MTFDLIVIPYVIGFAHGFFLGGYAAYTLQLEPWPTIARWLRKTFKKEKK